MSQRRRAGGEGGREGDKTVNLGEIGKGSERGREGGRGERTPADIAGLTAFCLLLVLIEGLGEEHAIGRVQELTEEDLEKFLGEGGGEGGREGRYEKSA